MVAITLDAKRHVFLVQFTLLIQVHAGAEVCVGFEALIVKGLLIEEGVICWLDPTTRDTSSRKQRVKKSTALLVLRRLFSLAKSSRRDA
jgi:hypothetical protein